ncbi:MAG: RNA 2',3'-cyclic phosphodiesterase [Bifidobacteriaceae bacterium]|nr:RNA 2',3'-cyclic phosphodiesterase [Bifidobacteriaceae bacterium]
MGRAASTPRFTRAFAAIVLPWTARTHLRAALGSVPDAYPDQWTPLANWHITLAFYGDVTPARLALIGEGLSRAAASQAPFDIWASGVGSFRTGATWIGVGGARDELTTLMLAAQSLSDDAGPHLAEPVAHSRDRQPIPHITVSRKGCSGQSTAWALADYRGPVWTVDRIALMASHLGRRHGERTHYTTLAQMVFGATP